MTETQLVRRKTPADKARLESDFTAYIDTLLVECSQQSSAPSTPGFREYLLKYVQTGGMIVPLPAQITLMALHYAAGYEVARLNVESALEETRALNERLVAEMTALEKKLKVEKTAADTLHTAACSAFDWALIGDKTQEILGPAINATGPELPTELELTPARSKMLLKVAAAGKDGYRQPERAGIRHQLAAETRLLRDLTEAGLLEDHPLPKSNSFNPYRWTLTKMGQLRAWEIAAAEPQLGPGTSARARRERKAYAELAARVRDAVEVADAGRRT